MRTKHPPLLPIFRSRLQGELLAAVLLVPGQASSISDLSQRIGAHVSTVQREVDRLERAGILTSRRVGRARLVSANTEIPVYRPLAQLVLLAFGPAQVLAEELRALKGVERAYIFGSWAERYKGIEGPPPGDIDVLIVGNPDRDELYEATLRAEERLQHEIGATVRTSEAWLSADDAFLRQVRSSPLVAVLDKIKK
jgi:predicted nucleotidyltransferase